MANSLQILKPIKAEINFAAGKKGRRELLSFLKTVLLLVILD